MRTTLPSNVHVLVLEQGISLDPAAVEAALRDVTDQGDFGKQGNAKRSQRIVAQPPTFSADATGGGQELRDMLIAAVEDIYPEAKGKVGMRPLLTAMFITPRPV